MKNWASLILMLFTLFTGVNDFNSCCSLPNIAPNCDSNSKISYEGCSIVSSESQTLASGCDLSTTTIHCDFGNGLNVSITCAYRVCDYGDFGTIEGQCYGFTF